METDATVDARGRLEELQAELARRGWATGVRGSARRPVLHVCNPADHGLNDSVAFENGMFCWYWGPELGDDVPAVADLILHILREAGS